MNEHQCLPRSPELMSRGDTALLVVDVQEKLVPAIADHARVVWNVRRLIDGAKILGLPVVATDIRGCREEVVNGVTGLIVAPRDADALFDAVSFLLDHPERAVEMGRTGRRRAAEVYDERLVCESLNRDD